MSRKTTKTLRYIDGGLCFAAMAAIVLFVRFSNPAMTETQLLINFWWVWLIGIGLATIGSLLIQQ